MSNDKDVQDIEKKPVELTAEEAKKQVIEKFGLTEEDNSELIEKLTADTLENHKKLVTAIGQKIKIRTEKEELEKQVKTVVPPTPAQIDEDKISKLVMAQLEKRELDSSGLSEKIRKEAEMISKANNMPVSQVLKSDYIQFLKEKEETEQRNEDASLGNTKKNAKEDYGSINPLELDLRTPEGKAKHAKWEEALKKKLG